MRQIVTGLFGLLVACVAAWLVVLVAVLSETEQIP